MRREPTPTWPSAVPIARGRAAAGMTCLSDLPIKHRRSALQEMQQQQPELAALVGRMGKTFGRLRLYVDPATAQALGVSR